MSTVARTHARPPQGFRAPARRSYHHVPFPDRKRVERVSLNCTLWRAQEYPKILADYWRVAQVMQRKELIPFVHGRKATWIIPQRILQALGYRHCETLRAPGFTEGAEEILAEAQRVYKTQKLNPLRWLFLYHLSPLTSRRHQLDHQMKFRRHLLSVTLGAFHGDADETPFSWVFGGEVYASKFLTHEGNRSAMGDEDSRACMAEMVASAMKVNNYHESTAQKLLEKSWTFYEEAERFPIGQLLVVGVPLKLLQRVVYQSKEFGIPTGASIQEVVQQASDHGLYAHEYQARLIFCKESMDVNSGIEVVSMMDEEAVSQYCQGVALPSPWEDKRMQRILEVKRTELEDRTLANFHNFHQRLDQMVRTMIRR